MIKPLIETKNFLIQNEPDVFHDTINEQFKQTMNNIVLEEFSKKFPITPEEAVTILEDVSLEEFFK